ELVKNDIDLVEYKTSSNTNQFAVFSEVFYDAGWKAFIDSKQVPVSKVNYVLRGVSVPAGTHVILFKFEPGGYLLGRQLTNIFTILLLLLVGAGIFFEWRGKKNFQERKDL
ncbi:MAG: YfhO family protein, partial [Chitinophagaceae bacterium]